MAHSRNKNLVIYLLNSLIKCSWFTFTALFSLLPHRKKLYVLVLIFVFTEVIYISWVDFSPPDFPDFCEGKERYPKLQPFHKSIKHLIRETSFPRCGKGSSLFISTANTIIPVKTHPDLLNGLVHKCCYKVISKGPRGTKNENRFRESTNCTPISLETSTDIPMEHEFTAVYCTYKGMEPQQEVLIDMVPYVHLKPDIEARVGSSGGRPGMSVLIIGLDGTSHMNFLRTFPKTHSFLMDNMSAIEMNWYNKIGYTTYANLVPALMGRWVSQIEQDCGKNKRYDNCSFIWKEFSKRGYRTAYGEDYATCSIFDCWDKLGFEKPPTDYYLRPFTVAVDQKLWKFSRKFNDYLKMCHGNRLIFEELLAYARKFIETMDLGRKEYFYFMWSTSLARDLNDYRFGDPHLLKTLQWLKEGHLENTTLIVMSDHGDSSGPIRQSLQGRLENNLPLLYFVFSKRFRESYPQAYQNLRGNHNRLVTPFDLHETLMELANADIKLGDDQIRKRQLNGVSSPTSMFLPISSTRTCTQANVPQGYCMCNKLTPVPISDVVKVAAESAVKSINDLLSKYNLCVPLQLAKITSAEKMGSQFGQWESYQVVFETVPGNALFQALVANEGKNSWNVVGTIERTNWFGNQSYCVHERFVKSYCYCGKK